MEEKLNVLMIGNGVNRAFGKTSWNALIDIIKTRDDINAEQLQSPMPLKAILLSNNKIDEQLKNVNQNSQEILYGIVESEEQTKMLRQILTIGFDHILTTNYSYELEIASLGQISISKKQLLNMSTHTPQIKRVEAKFLLHSYNEVVCEEANNKIWHIHGESRKPESVILGHYNYGSLMYKMKDYMDKRGKIYRNKEKTNEIIDIESWLDAFVLGDVYVIGFRYDLSEFDLWWLLNRKAREKVNHGKVYFYEPEPMFFDERLELLKALDVQVEHLGMKLTDYKEENGHIYKEFYKKALNEIDIKIKTGSKSLVLT